MYSIQDLERLSGIKAHTIRVWEKRYNLLEPDRTDTNIRYYNDDQLRKLLNTSTLITHGGKISKVSKLSESEMSSEVEALMMPASKGEQLDVFINKIIESGLSYNNQLFEAAFAAASIRLGLYRCYRHVIIPTLIKLGLMWGTNNLWPAQEHFISNLIRQKLFAAIDGLNVPEANSKKYLLFLPEYEHHEIGLLFAHYLIRKSGKTVIYLGPNVPTQDLEATIKRLNPDVLILFVVRTWHKDELISMMQRVTKSFKKGKTILCGRSALTDVIQENKSLVKAQSIEDLENKI